MTVSDLKLSYASDTRQFVLTVIPLKEVHPIDGKPVDFIGTWPKRGLAHAGGLAIMPNEINVPTMPRHIVIGRDRVALHSETKTVNL